MELAPLTGPGLLTLAVDWLIAGFAAGVGWTLAHRLLG